MEVTVGLGFGMTYRGTVRNGVIVLSNAELPEGMSVRVSPESSPKRKRIRKPRTRRSTSRPLPGFGMWKDRKEWRGKSSVEVARELRRAAMGERYRG